MKTSCDTRRDGGRREARVAPGFAGQHRTRESCEFALIRLYESPTEKGSQHDHRVCSSHSVQCMNVSGPLRGELHGQLGRTSRRLLRDTCRVRRDGGPRMSSSGCFPTTSSLTGTETLHCIPGGITVSKQHGLLCHNVCSRR